MTFKKPFHLVFVLLIAFTGCKNKTENLQQESVKYVKIQTVQNAESKEKLVFNGTIKEKSLTSLSFRVGGPLAELDVLPGDYVSKGQVIAVIDKRDYQLQVNNTKVQLEQIEGEYQRYKQLAEQNKIPENTFEKIKSGYLMAKTGYENACNQLGDTELKAPFSGYIYEKFTEAHQTVSPGVPIVSIIDISQLEVVVSVPENLLQKVKADKRSILNVKNAGVSELPVKLLSISEKTMKDGMYEVKFSFNNHKNLKVAPGMSAEIFILCDEQSNQITIPSSAIFHEKTSDYVWVYNSAVQSIKKKQIVISTLKSGAQVEVVSGLKTGDQIVTAGVHYLFDGQKVKPVKPQAETNIGGLL